MTDKQIIIDGVDVSGCSYYADGKCTNSHMIQSNCKNVVVCYYKEYKRKEQECEELKKQLMQKSEVDMFFNTPLEGWSNDPCDICRYKQTLAEIKPILEYYENAKIGEKQEDGSYKLEFTFSDIATPYCIKYDPKPAREALRKINEVEDANNNR